MTAEDETAGKGIEARTNKLKALQRAITALRNTLSGKTREWEAQSSSLMADKTRLTAMARSLKDAARLLNQRQQARLKQLCLARCETQFAQSKLTCLAKLTSCTRKS